VFVAKSGVEILRFETLGGGWRGSITPVHKFHNLNAVTGIIEKKPSIYILLAGNKSSLGVAIHGTFSNFELDTRRDSSEP
jgi:hypothetical protein